MIMNNLLEINCDDTHYEPINLWDELGLKDDLLRGIFSYGFEYPSPVQKKAILPIIKKRDVIVQAQSGTGKTGTFAVAALQLIDLKLNETQVLVLSPTRELVTQSAKVIEDIGSMMNDLRVQEQFGGLTFTYDSRVTLPHVICGCTGRICDLIMRKMLNAETIKMVIIDEADEMLSYGFKEQVQQIFEYINVNAQVILVSATLPAKIYPVINAIMKNPIKLTVNADLLSLDGITQHYVTLESDREKYVTLKNLFSFLTVSQCIIYCNSIERVNELYEAMTADEFPVSRIHGGMEKVARDNSFLEFKCGKSRVLISSNVTARGIDIQQVSVVINFDVPKSVSTYLHRIGRSGRWGRKGVSINFVTRYDVHKIQEIEQYYSCQIHKLPEDLSPLNV